MDDPSYETGIFIVLATCYWSVTTAATLQLIRVAREQNASTSSKVQRMSFFFLIVLNSVREAFVPHSVIFVGLFPIS